MKTVEIPLSTLQKKEITQVNEEAIVLPGKKRVGVKTLGCKVNLFESEMISQVLQTKSWTIVHHGEIADCYIINTCTVTHQADRQARQEVRKLIRQNPEAIIVVTGCYAQIDAKACANIPGVDLVLGNGQKLDVHDILPEIKKGKLPRIEVGDVDQDISLPDKLLVGYSAHTRAFVQIQQGCNQGCTFCIIHKARGKSRSLPITLIQRQVQRLIINGYNEIVICGVDLGDYGSDFSLSYDLSDLLTELTNISLESDADFRIRISSIDPVHITDKFIDLMAENPKICPHIHLSLQSGNTLILKRMKRRYDADFVTQRIELLRKKVANLVLSADVMVGFPTEQEHQFEDTLSMVSTLDIPFAHVFSYSARQNTPAAKIPEQKQVDAQTKKQRNFLVRELSQQLLTKTLQKHITKTGYVLAEKPANKEGYWLCRAENYLSVLVPETQVKEGQWQQVRYTNQYKDSLIAESLE